jgi:biotin-(acetyl-CoA carboxylase) ligase
MLNRRRQHPYAGLLHEYAAHHCLNGQRITVALNGRTSDSGVLLTGRCEGIDDMGRLLLRSEGTVHRIVSGSIQKPTPVDRPRGRRRS